MISLFLISLVSFLGYMTFIVLKYGMPASISETYYLLPKKIGRIVFWAWTVLVALPLMIFGAEISPDRFPCEFMIFFCGTFLIGVGTAAQFKEDFVRKYHFIFAGICAAFSLGWIYFADPRLFWIPFALAVPYIIMGLAIKGVNEEGVKRNSLVAFLELVCFMSIYTCMFLYWLEVVNNI